MTEPGGETGSSGNGFSQGGVIKNGYSDKIRRVCYETGFPGEREDPPFLACLRGFIRPTRAIGSKERK